MVVASPVAGRAVVRFSPQAVAIAGGALVAVGLFAVSRWDAAPALVLLAPVLFVQGFGAGLFQVANLDMVTAGMPRSEEHTSELQSLMRISYAVFCLKKKKNIANV